MLFICCFFVLNFVSSLIPFESLFAIGRDSLDIFVIFIPSMEAILLANFSLTCASIIFIWLKTHTNSNQRLPRLSHSFKKTF